MRNTIRQVGLRLLILASGAILLFAPSCTNPAVPRIAVLQDKPQEWADALKLGFNDGLAQNGIDLGKDVIVVSRSAAGDPQALSTMSSAFAHGPYAVVYTLGTQTTQEVFRQRSATPIIFGAVTDPIAAGLYGADLRHPLGNITGTQDSWPYPAQFDLIRQLVPSAKSVGLVYNSSEVNSQVSVQSIKEEASRRGLRIIERTVTSEAEIQAAVAAVLHEGIDIFFIPADNTAQTSAPTIIALCQRQRVPVFTGIAGIVEQGALATVGTNYYELGKINAQQAIAILKQGKRAADIPVAVATKGDVYINLKTARSLGIEIPRPVLDAAVQKYE
jgi:putative ABC transport system substrate-binding protein